ncbi:hypothetical protein KOR34_51920 [Posidoniimonas corsicana]|uniref:DUF11 domain-containing protein n=1 Tax=Posidoniimonas corsicana TaxID=1938618 RepID=A0A5C5UV06_9BACT|nr:DUF11 domain-containing protein [Posidoniimonas corsicana]TWT29380.1 hypothetical protein KOR34_51920 [Posidoniimonas corsicana]
MRHITPLALILAVTLCCAPLASAQEGSRPSFAQRLASLRLGWGGSDEEEQDPRQAIEASAAQRRAGSAAEQEERSGISARLPRLDPSDLLPGERFAGSTNNRTTRRPTSAHLRHNRHAQPDSTSTTAGSARSRIMRDLRVQTSSETSESPRTASRTPARDTNPTSAAPATGNLAPRPQGPVTTLVPGRNRTARAGSVLSAGNGGEAGPAPEDAPSATLPPLVREADLRRELLGPAAFARGGSTKPRADDATAKSIAAAVASSMAAEAATADSEDNQTTDGASDIEAILAAEPGETTSDTDEAAAVEEQVAVDSSAEQAPAPEAEQEGGADRYAAVGLPPIPTGDQGSSDGTVAAAPQEDWRNAGRATPADTMDAVNNDPTPIAGPPAAVQQPAGAQDGFEQEVAKRRFEDTVEQSIEARTAAPQPAWDAAQQNQAPAPVASTALGASRDADLLMSQRMPQIVSRVSGPKQIVIGREAVYRVTIANRGDETADQLATTVTVPEWAEVVGSRSTVGLVEPPATSAGATSVLWKMAELQPGRTQHLDLKLVARQGRPIELGVNWKHAPVGSRTVVEVQEPKLAVALDGPDEVLFGKPQVYRLHVSNPGTGPAEDVRVQVVPPGGGPASQSLGNLLPNESRTIEFKVTGAEAGELKLQAQAAAMGGLSEQTSKSVFCRKPELEVDWRGPARKYAGASATYYFRVRNPGTATAEGVEFRVNLPQGFEVSKASGNGRVDAAGRQLQWGVGSLRPGDDYYMELQGVINQPGANEFAMGAMDRERMASSTTTATTEVIALADLKLEIRDPKGPLPVGREAVYEVRVRNRGTSAARKVKIVGLFSEGIEPYKVEGAQASIADGRVAIRTVESLTVGSELVLMIHAKATKPGAHLFRAEVLCEDLDIKLAAEESTRFYTEERIDLGQAPARSANMADRFSTPR